MSNNLSLQVPAPPAGDLQLRGVRDPSGEPGEQGDRGRLPGAARRQAPPTQEEGQGREAQGEEDSGKYSQGYSDYSIK